ncbi:MAG: hypothetical protein JWO40_675 [Candidatus Doudnabacteria bacterium]|nr:hypothetical protein [Candidatus Doudnabacteria bacterium]
MEIGKEEKDENLFSPDPTDANLALAWLRIEVEKRIRKIAEINDVKDTNRGVSLLLHQLVLKGFFDESTTSGLANLLSILNGVQAITKGNQLIGILNAKIRFESKKKIAAIISA